MKYIFPFLKLIRYQNLIMLAFMQVVFRYGFFKFQNIPLALTDFQYSLLILSSVLIAAAGYVINNIFDQDTDLENKPNNVVIGKLISESKAYTIYAILNCVGVGIGFYLSNCISKPGFAALFILIAAGLYLYASSLKQMLLIGNFVVAFLLSFSVIIIGIFDLFPILNRENQPQISLLFSILLDYAIFTFILNFIREIVKDLEDIDGDRKQEMNTLAIYFGIQKTTKIVLVFSCIPLILILNYIYSNLFQLVYVSLFLLLFVVAPLGYFTITIGVAKTKTDFHKLSILLKWILLFGIFSILIITINRITNA